MTHKLGLRVIAEGVETREQRAQLLSQGCDEVQGFLWAKPVSADELPGVVHALQAASIDLSGDGTEGIRFSI